MKMISKKSHIYVYPKYIIEMVHKKNTAELLHNNVYQPEQRQREVVELKLKLGSP
jgi:hypothetical protein